MSEILETDDDCGPARPAKLSVDFYDEPDGIALHMKRGGGPGLFLLLWLIGWTVGCVFLTHQVIHEPSIGMFAFAIPFWASWLAVAAFLVWILFGKETLLLRPDKALFLRKAFVTLSTRVVPRCEIRSFCECHSSHTENDQHLWGIEMTTLGTPLRFCYRLPDQERAWLIHQLNRFLALAPAEGATADRSALITRKAASTVPAASPSDPDDDAASGAAASGARILKSADALPEVPSDSPWTTLADFSALVLHQRGRLSLGAVAGLLFINLFWNGIVSVFVLVLLGLMPQGNPPQPPPQGAEWWGMFVFLTPFEAIGLLMFAGLVLTILAPFWHETWRFDPDRITQENRLLLYRRRRLWEIAALGRLELRRQREEGEKAGKITDLGRGGGGERPFELVFVSGENADVCSIDNLTEGEARWIGGLVMDQCRHWFARGGR